MDHEHHSSELQSNCASASQSACKFLSETLTYPDRRLGQSIALMEGAVLGGVNAVSDGSISSQELVSQVESVALIGGAMGLATKLRNPLITGAVVAGSTIAAGAFLWDTTQKLGTDKQLHSTLNDIWMASHHSDAASTCTLLEEHLGHNSLDLASSAACDEIAFGDIGKFANSRLLKDLRLRVSHAVCPEPGTHIRHYHLLDRLEINPDIFAAMNGDVEWLPFMKPSKPLNSYFPYIEKTPLKDRLNDLGAAICKGDYQEVFDQLCAQIAWYKQRDALLPNIHLAIRKALFQVGIGLHEHLHFPDHGHEQIALARIARMTRRFGVEHDWPMELSPSELLSGIRISKLSVNERLTEIDRLIEHGMLYDAFGISQISSEQYRRKSSFQLEQKFAQLCELISNPQLDSESDRPSQASIDRVKKLMTAMRKLPGGGKPQIHL